MNHQTEAEKVDSIDLRTVEAMEHVMVAQTHAILAIAEQLRVANLIALWNAEDKSSAAAIFDDDQELNWPWGILAAQIAEALGIEQP